MPGPREQGTTSPDCGVPNTSGSPPRGQAHYTLPQLYTSRLLTGCIGLPKLQMSKAHGQFLSGAAGGLACWELMVGPYCADPLSWYRWTCACLGPALQALLKGSGDPESYLKTHAPFRTKGSACAAGAHSAHHLGNKR